jgi:hypothetical protein
LPRCRCPRCRSTTTARCRSQRCGEAPVHSGRAEESAGKCRWPRSRSAPRTRRNRRRRSRRHRARAPSCGSPGRSRSTRRPARWGARPTGNRRGWPSPTPKRCSRPPGRALRGVQRDLQPAGGRALPGPRHRPTSACPPASSSRSRCWPCWTPDAGVSRRGRCTSRRAADRGRRERRRPRGRPSAATAGRPAAGRRARRGTRRRR